MPWFYGISTYKKKILKIINHETHEKHERGTDRFNFVYFVPFVVEIGFREE